MSSGIARMVAARGFDAARVAHELLDGLRDDAAPEPMRLVVVYADWRVDPAVLARTMQDALPVPVVGCTTVGVVAGQDRSISAAAVAFVGDWLRIGIGVATDLPKHALARSRDAVHQAAMALGATTDTLDPSRHVAFTLVDGSCGHEETFCIASAAAAPQIRVVGGSAATEIGSGRRASVWLRGETYSDAGIVVVLESALLFEAFRSQHMIATELKTVVTEASGRTLDELDGHPAADRLRTLVRQLGGTLDESRPSEYSFARFVDGVPYLRSMTRIEGSRVHLATSVEVGHVLRLMRPGDLIGRTRDDLADVAARVGGQISALLVFSCIGRHWEAAARSLEQPLADVYAAYPTIGFQSFGEQTGMLLVNHTLTGLAIGVPR